MGQAISRPDGEMERLVAVRSIMSFKNADMPELKVLSQLGQGVFGVPRAAVHIVDEDWLHIAEQAGMELSECSRDLSICSRVITKRDVVIISDLTEHPDFRFMPYVKGGPGLRSYAGAPIEPGAGPRRWRLLPGRYGTAEILSYGNRQLKTFCIVGRRASAAPESQFHHESCRTRACATRR